MTDPPEFEHAYGAEQIQVLKGLEPVRKRPGNVHRQTTGPKGSGTTSFMVVDNSVDEGPSRPLRRNLRSASGDERLGGSSPDNGRGIPHLTSNPAPAIGPGTVLTVACTPAASSAVRLKQGVRRICTGWAISGGQALERWVEVSACAARARCTASALEHGHTDRIYCALKPTGQRKTGTPCASSRTPRFFTVGIVFDYATRLQRRLRELALPQHARARCADRLPRPKRGRQP